MKKRVIFAMLSVSMLITLIVISVIPGFAADAVYYPNGTIILDETLLNPTAEGFSEKFSVGAGEATCSWNAESGRVKLEATKNTVLNLNAIPEGLDNYTISADLYLTASTYTKGAVLFGMGINSASQWSRGLYFQINLPSTGDVVMYVNNYNEEGSNINGGGSSTKTVLDGGYTIGTSKINVTIKVGTEMVRVYYNDNLMFTIAKEHLAYKSGNPFFIVRQDSTLEIDNLLVYSGTGEPDFDKVIGEVGSIDAPETDEPPITTDSDTTETKEPPVSQTTERETQRPAAPTDESKPVTDSETNPETDVQTPKSSGCQSGIGMGLLVIGTVATGACAICGKRKND